MPRTCAWKYNKISNISRLLHIVSTDFVALRLFCFNLGQHGRQILYFILHVDGRRFHNQKLHATVRRQVVHRCTRCMINYPLYDATHEKSRLHKRATHASAQSSRKSQVYKTRVRNLSLAMYPFGISIDDRVPPKISYDKIADEKYQKSTKVLMWTFRILQL